jgi:predicted dehydrogenase
MTDWGVHLIDMALWAKDIASAPKKVFAYGENLSFRDHSRETYDTMSVVYPMDDYVINWQHTGGIQSGPYDRPYGVEFVGDRATVVADRNDWVVKIENEKDRDQAIFEAESFKKASEFSDMENHVRNFIDCIKTRNKTNCPIETGRNVALYAHMANIAARSGMGSIAWDESSQTFGDNQKANDLIMPAYRKPWDLLKV